MMVYIAGPMTGLGYTVISPAWMSDGLPRKSYLPICMAMIDQCDAIVLLDGWD